VIALDHVGMGLSEQPVGRPLKLADHAANLGSALDQLGVERAILFVHDWGGPIGLDWARGQPERLAGLIVSNTAAFAWRSVPLRIRLARSELLGGPAILAGNAFARGLVAMASAKPLAPKARRAYLAPGESRGGREAQYAFVRDIPLAPADPSWDELAAIERFLPSLLEKPAIVLWGERDWCFTPRLRAEWERRLPWAPSTFFSGAGHLLLEDEPNSAAALVQHFVVQRAAN
jgi:haloalkane dehalogenase